MFTQKKVNTILTADKERILQRNKENKENIKNNDFILVDNFYGRNIHKYNIRI